MIQGGGFTPHAAKATRAPDATAGSPERPEERPRHDRHGPHPTRIRPPPSSSSTWSTTPSLTERPSRRVTLCPTATATPCSARWSRAWTPWTRSRTWSHRQPGGHQNVPKTPSPSSKPLWRNNHGQSPSRTAHRRHGVITLELDADKAPLSTANFLSYVNKGHYNNTVFHRVIPGFMVQGGGFEPGMNQKPTDKRRSRTKPTTA
jgi:hypothetical protein